MVKLILLTCFALSAAGLVRRDVPAPSPLEDLQKHAAEFQNTFSEQLSALVNSKNTQEVTELLKETSDSLLKDVSKYCSTLQGALSDANGKSKNAVEATVTNLKKTVEELHQAHPEVEQQTSALRDKLQAAVLKIAKETENLAKVANANVEETNKKLEPTIKAAYGDFVKQVEAMKNKLHEAVDKQ